MNTFGKAAGLLCTGAATMLCLLAGFCAATESANRVATGYSLKVFYDNDIKDVTAAMKLWSKELASHYGLMESVTVYEDARQLARDFGNRTLDAAVMTTPEYFAMQAQFQGPLAFTPLRDGKKTERFVVLARADAGHADLGALRNRRLAYVKYDDFSMVYLDSLLLRKRLPAAERLFASRQPKNRPYQAIHAVFFGQADACVTTVRALRNAAEMNPQIAKQIRILAESPDLITGVSVFRNDLDVKTKNRVIEAMHRFKEYPRGKQVLSMLQMDDVGMLYENDLAETRRFFEEHKRLNRGRP